MLNFGDKVKDKVTGFEGIIVGKGLYANGCNRYAVQGSKLKEDGTPSSWVWIDVEQCKLIESGAVTFGDTKPSGGPMPDPTSSRGGER